MSQAAKQEPERAFIIAKVRHMVDSARTIQKIPEAVSAKTRGEAHRKRIEAAPVSLKRRVETGEPLPEVDVRDEGEDEEMGRHGKKHRVSEVARFVAFHLKAELVVELLQTIRPRWSQ